MVQETYHKFAAMVSVATISSYFYKTSRGTTLHYTQSGNLSGRLIICSHGLGGSTETFAPLLPFLTKQSDYNIICLDSEGLGRTPLTSQDTRLSIPRYVTDLDDLISFLQGRAQSESATEVLTGKPVVLVGHSLGSIISLHYAANKASNVAGLAVLGVGRLAAHIPAARERMLGLAASVRKEGITKAADLAVISNFPVEGVAQGVRDAVRDAVGSSDPEGYARTCEAIMDPVTHGDPEYGRINCPSVFISGESDPLSPVSRAEGLKKLIGRNAVVKVVGKGHHPILEDIVGVEKAIAELLAKI